MLKNIRSCFSFLHSFTEFTETEQYTVKPPPKNNNNNTTTTAADNTEYVGVIMYQLSLVLNIIVV